VADHAVNFTSLMRFTISDICNPGLDPSQDGMWCFLGSDCMFFGSLIGRT